MFFSFYYSFLFFFQEHNEEFAQSKRLIGMLNMAQSELPTPLYYLLTGMAHLIRCTEPSEKQFLYHLVKNKEKVTLHSPNCSPSTRLGFPPDPELSHCAYF